MLSKYTRFIYLICILGGTLVLHGCSALNRPVAVPTYIHIDSFQFQDKNKDLIHALTNSHQITQVWAYYNNASIGTFDLPATIPVVATGTGSLELFPGVAINGQNNSLATYPFYMPDTSFTFTAQPGKILNYTPKTDYYPDVKVTAISNFDGEIYFALDQTGGNVPMTDVSADSLVFEGYGSGNIYLVTGDSSQDSSTVRFTIPAGNSIIEFNYKCNIPFYVGLKSNLANIAYQLDYLYGVAPSATWQKFYLNVSNFVASYPGDNYNFYIKTYLPQGYSNGRVLLDNIQLLTF